MKKLLFTLFTLYTFTIQAEDLKAIEKDLLTQFKKIDYWGTQPYSDGQTDSIYRANEIFSNKLLNYTSKNAATLSYDFKDLKSAGLFIATSADKKFRIYTWDTWTGGTMKFFDGVFQFQGETKLVSEKMKSRKDIEGDPMCFYSEIFTLDTNGVKAYIGSFYSIGSTRDHYAGVKMFRIQKNTLNDTLHLIKTKTGVRNELGFSFNFFSVVDRPERPLKLVLYDPKNKTIKIPVVIDDGNVTNRFITYKFMGKYFEKVSK